jgi:uncharacterized protein
MILDLDRLTEDVERISSRETIAFRDVLGAENHIDSDIDLDVRRVEEIFYIHVALSGVFPTQCHRCLEPTTFNVKTSFELVVQRGEDLPDGAETRDEDYIHLPYSESKFSLDDQIHEHLIVNIPIQITCRESCRGLCPGCGINLNLNACECSPGEEARWDALKDLRDKFPDKR